MTVDFPPIDLPILLQANTYQIIIAALIVGIIMATSRTPKYLFVTIPFLFACTVLCVVCFWNLFQINSSYTTVLLIAGTAIAYIWRENKADVKK